jgi:GNAT superfamily N-acetyltransferase
MIEIRAATVDDSAALAGLRWEFRSAQDPATETQDEFVRRCAAWMRRELSIGGAWNVWVAVDRQVIVGQVWVQTVQKIPNPAAESERLAYLSNLFVQTSARGGIGTRLLAIALDWCRANQVDRVFLWPSARSVTLYLRHGFSRNADVMELKIRS